MFQHKSLKEMGDEAQRRQWEKERQADKQASNPIPDTTMKLDIDQRVTVSLALQRYMRALEQFEKASNDFNESCQVVRGALPPDSRLIANLNHQHYLVTSDDAGNFQVEQIDTV